MRKKEETRQEAGMDLNIAYIMTFSMKKEIRGLCDPMKMFV